MEANQGICFIGMDVLDVDYTIEKIASSTQGIGWEKGVTAFFIKLAVHLKEVETRINPLFI